MNLRSYILSAALCSLSALYAVTPHKAAPSATERPKLVVCVVVDQLRTDYLEFLSPLMSRDGFNRLMAEGTYLRNVSFAPSRLDAVSATAMLMSGATPDLTGLPSERVWNNSALKMIPALQDADYIGNFTSQSYSPRALRLSTLTDEVMIDGAGLGAAWSLAIDPQIAVTMASHAGSGAVWLDLNTGKWCGSTYYKELPQCVTSGNYSRPLSSSLDTMQWKPLLPLDRYPGLPAQKRYYPFRHTFPSSAKDAYERFAASPKGNTALTDLAIETLNTLHLGARGDAIDMLCLGYSLAPYKYVKDGDYRLELSDAYLRLDRDIARLLTAVEKVAGPGGAIVMIASTGYYNDAVPDDDKYRIPSGTFSVKRATSLLNAFLTARHGQGNYVSAYADGALYLNRQQLEKANVTPTQAAEEAKEFLIKMSGVEAVYTITDLLSSTSDKEEALRLSIDPRSGIDLLIEINPGWMLSDDAAYPPLNTPVRRARHIAPAMLYGTPFPPLSVDSPVEATALAPTLAGALHIRQPNGVVSAPVVLPLKNK